MRATTQTCLTGGSSARGWRRRRWCVLVAAGGVVGGSVRVAGARGALGGRRRRVASPAGASTRCRRRVLGARAVITRVGRAPSSAGGSAGAVIAGGAAAAAGRGAGAAARIVRFGRPPASAAGAPGPRHGRPPRRRRASRARAPAAIRGEGSAGPTSRPARRGRRPGRPGTTIARQSSRGGPLRARTPGSSAGRRPGVIAQVRQGIEARSLVRAAPGENRGVHRLVHEKGTSASQGSPRRRSGCRALASPHQRSSRT